MRKLYLGTTILTIITLAAFTANAIQISVSAGGSAWSGKSYLNFDGASPAIVSFSGDAGLVSGTQSKYAAPYVSGGNNVHFGDNYTGADKTSYVTSGKLPGSITFNFGQDCDYFGLLWGSVDAYNTLEFIRDGESVGVVTGRDAVNPANGYQGQGGSAYVNIWGITFDRVIAISSSYAFEIDNVAYGKVPDGGMTLILLGTALSAMGLIRRKMS
jgi:hypothetical protein